MRGEGVFVAPVIRVGGACDGEGEADGVERGL